MSSPLIDKEISELYQQRKHQTTAPSVNIDALITPKVKVKSFSQKFVIILSVSSLASFSILALINQLRQPVEINTNKGNINLTREIKLVSIKNDKSSSLAIIPTIEKIPPRPQAANQPEGDKTSVITHVTPISGEENLIHQLENQNIEINTQISTDTLNFILVKKVQPKYPIKAQQMKLHGFVKLSYQIDSSGSIINITVNESTNKLFTKSALKALNQWKYERHNKAEQNKLLQHKIEFTFNTD